MELTKQPNEYYTSTIEKSPFLSKNSKITYISNLTNLSKNIGASLHSIVFNPNLYSRKILEIDNLNTKKTYLTSLLALLKYTQIKTKFPNIFEAWYGHFIPVRNEVEQRENEHIASDKQKNSMISWKEVKQMRDDQAKGSIEHLLLTLYISFTRRQLDYYKVKIYTKPEQVPDQITHIHLGVPTPYIYIKEFKTVKFFKPFKEVLPRRLLKSIKASLRRFPRSYLFEGMDGNPFKSSNSFQKFSNKMLKRLFKNPNMTVNSLRHSAATFINNIPNIKYAERKRYARNMGHSIDKQLVYDLAKYDEKVPNVEAVSTCYKKEKSGKFTKHKCAYLKDAHGSKISPVMQKLLRMKIGEKLIANT